MTEAVARYRRHASLASEVAGQYDHLVSFMGYDHEAAIEQLGYDYPSYGWLSNEDNIVWLLSEHERLKRCTDQATRPSKQTVLQQA